MVGGHFAIRLALRKMLPAAQEVDTTNAPPQIMWHGTQTTRLASILAAGRLVRGSKEHSGKYGIFAVGGNAEAAKAEALRYSPPMHFPK